MVISYVNYTDCSWRWVNALLFYEFHFYKFARYANHGEQINDVIKTIVNYIVVDIILKKFYVGYFRTTTLHVYYNLFLISFLSVIQIKISRYFGTNFDSFRKWMVAGWKSTMLLRVYWKCVE